MVRNYQRKSEKIPGEKVRAAIRYFESVSHNQRETCRAFGLTRSFFQKYLKRDLEDIPEECTQGGKGVFTMDQEDEIISYVLSLANRFYAMTRPSLGELAYQLALRNNIIHPFKNGTAGNGWITGFLQRHEDQLSLRTGTPTSLLRITEFKRSAVYRFFDLFEEILHAKGFTAETIFNMDETGVTIVPSRRFKRIAQKGSRSVPVMVPVERGELCTIICCFNAAGSYIPPLFVIPKSVHHMSMEHAPLNSKFAVSDRGWSNSKCFLQWLKLLRAFAADDRNTPILLLLDNHGSHISYEAVRYCRSHAIELLTIPPHSTHKLQPLDVSFFSPLKSKYSQYLLRWLAAHPHQKPRIEDIPAIFKLAFRDAAKPDTAINGFIKTGIWKQNPVTGTWGPNKHEFDADFVDETSDDEDTHDGSGNDPDSPRDSPPDSPAASPPTSPPVSPPISRAASPLPSRAVFPPGSPPAGHSGNNDDSSYNFFGFELNSCPPNETIQPSIISNRQQIWQPWVELNEDRNQHAHEGSAEISRHLPEMTPSVINSASQLSAHSIPSNQLEAESSLCLPFASQSAKSKVKHRRRASLVPMYSQSSDDSDEDSDISYEMVEICEPEERPDIITGSAEIFDDNEEFEAIILSNTKPDREIPPTFQFGPEEIGSENLFPSVELPTTSRKPRKRQKSEHITSDENMKILAKKAADKKKKNSSSDSEDRRQTRSIAASSKLNLRSGKLI